MKNQLKLNEIWNKNGVLSEHVSFIVDDELKYYHQLHLHHRQLCLH
jgi:hypothetical protein